MSPTPKQVIGIVLILGAAVVSLIGCLHQPEIPGYHWHGSSLYNGAGIEVASVVAMPFGVGSSQACIFSASKLPEEVCKCTYWETGQEAYDHVREVFASGTGETGKQ